MTICPKGVQWVLVSTTISPVTHAADVAVKSASRKDVLTVELIGKDNNRAPTKISVMKLSANPSWGDNDNVLFVNRNC